MSSLIVEVCQVDEVQNHPSADRMAVARIKGWFVCVARDAVTGEPWVKPGQKVVYFPPDCILPAEVADKFGVTKYLGKLPKSEDGTRPSGGRVLVAKLRGVQSYGFVAPLDDESWEIGKDVAVHYNITKYEPPLRANQGDAEKPHPAFHRYYDMENIRNFPYVFADGEEIVCTEKVHGENCRLGLIKDVNEKGEAVWKWMAGTHEIRRKQFWFKKDKETGQPVGDPITSAPWLCFSPEIRQLLCYVSCCGYQPEEIDQEPLVKTSLTSHSVVLFGERFGCVQDMKYGHENGQFSFRAFDIALNGRWIDYDEKIKWFAAFKVPMVPEVYRGPYSFDKIQELTEGPTMVTDKVTGEKNFREGIVILTTKERTANTEKKFMDRAQLKSISFSYLNRKDGTEYH
jgi:hypothetical protein